MKGNFFSRSELKKKRSEDERVELNIRMLEKVLTAVIVLLIGSVVLFLMSSCSPKIVEVEKVHTEYIHSTDTVKEVDSVYSEKETIIKEADSTMIAELGLKLKYNERAFLILQKELEKLVSIKTESKTDTVIKNDTIPVPYPVEKLVEKNLTWWQKARLYIADVGLMALGLWIIIFIIKKRRLIGL